MESESQHLMSSSYQNQRPGNSSGGDEEEENHPWKSSVQKACKIGSHSCSLLTVLVAYWWTTKLGGLSSWSSSSGKDNTAGNFVSDTIEEDDTQLRQQEQQQQQQRIIFNWHPFLMIIAFCFMTVAMTTYRFPRRRPASSQTPKIYMHTTALFIAALCAIFGLWAVFSSSHQKQQQQHHHDAFSMYSFHALVGLTIILLYIVQFLMGSYSFVSYYNMILPFSFEAVILQLHMLLGPLFYWEFKKWKTT